MRTRGLSRASGHVCDSGSLGESEKGSVLGIERQWYHRFTLLVMIFFFKLQAGAVKNEKVPKWESRCPTVPLECAQ